MAEDLSGYLAGLVLSCEEVPKKDKLKKLSIDIGADEPVDVVTNAGNVGTRTVGCRVVVATVGAAAGSAAPVAKSTGPGVDALFEKKLSKEEKKAALAAKRAAKKAAKEGGGAEEGGEDEQ
jgi:tRNA-binding EMAP/Myf-like protein